MKRLTGTVVFVERFARNKGVTCNRRAVSLEVGKVNGS